MLWECVRYSFFGKYADLTFMTKTCRGCQKDKSLDDYYNHPRGRHGKQPRCKQCLIEATKAKRKKDPTWNRRTEQIGRARKDAKKYGCKSTLTRVEWDTVIESHQVDEQVLCHICLDPIDLNKPYEFCLEHIIPLSRGGSNTKENVAPAQHFCNNAKRYLSLDEFVSFCQKVVDAHTMQ